MKKKLILINIIIFIFATQAVISQTIPENKELLKIRKEVQQMVDEGKIPSLAIGVIKDGKIVWQESIGYSDIEKKQKATINSVYPLGSISKSITASGIMTLVNEGKLRLSQDINPLILPIELKDINGESPKIKLWQLVSMNGGLNHSYGVFDSEKNLPLSKEERKKFFSETSIIAFPPGTVYEYANNAFDISEMLIENRTKKTFQDYMAMSFFEPLAMNSTYSYYYKYQKKADFVSTYTTKLKKIERENISYPSGGSGFWSSLKDMTKYAMFHLGNTSNPRVISKANLKLMHDFRQGSADLFGIGWFNNGGILVSNGNVGGGNAHITVDRKNNLAVICLLNRASWDGIADQFAGKIRKVFVKEKDNGFDEWRRIYGTPYSSRIDLVGKWKGIIKEPVSNKTIPIEIHFDYSNKISIFIDEKKYELSDSTFNLLRELGGSFSAPLPPIYEKETRCGIKLKQTNDKLSGYIQYDSFSKERFYRLPLFVELEKE